MSKDLKVKETAYLAEPAPEGAWGAEGASARDILIPKLLVMQGLSELVTQEKAKMGDIVNSVTGKVLGGKDKTITIIPIKTFSTWINFERQGDKLIYKGIIPVTPENENLPIEEKGPNGEEIRRDMAINFYVLLDSEAENPEALPYLISFRRTAKIEGKKLSTFFINCQRARKAPAMNKFALGTRKRQNDDGTWYVPTIEEAGLTAQPKVNVAYSWYKTINSGVTKADVEADLKDDAAPVRNVTPAANSEAMAEF